MKNQKHIVIFGGTGFIGLSLAFHLKELGYESVLVARNNSKQKHPFKFVAWDAVNVGDWKYLLDDAEAIVNLAGKSVDCIKSPDNCDTILRSRVDSCKVIGKALLEIENKPKVWVQMSTAHIYGDPPSQIIDESSSFGYGLAPTVGKAWEEAYHQSVPENIRKVILRTSFVIGKNGGALKSLKRIVNMGLGGKSGSGKQGISWIHEYDMNQIIVNSIFDNNYNGAYIATAPNPVSNYEFMKSLRKAMNMPIGLSAPELIIRIGARFVFRTDPELVLYGRYIVPTRLLKQNYKFKFSLLKDALNDLV